MAFCAAYKSYQHQRKRNEENLKVDFHTKLDNATFLTTKAESHICTISTADSNSNFIDTHLKASFPGHLE